MEISFKGPVMPIDPCSQLAFVEILNIILIAKHIMDVNRYLIARNVNPQFGSLSGYFRWSFADERFTLWQRTDYNSDMCFSYWICRSVCLQQRIKRMMREYSTNHQRIWKRQSRYPTER